jgi:FkbM family methyltransferase
MNCRDYEPHLSKFVRRWVQPGMTAIDIGANVGFYSMLFGDLVGSSGRVLAFEPNSENCRLLMLSIAANGYSHVRLYPFALSHTLGALCFTSHLGSNGGLLPNTGQTITQPNCIVVPGVPLDAIVCESVDFIKVDTEGAEYLALSGAERLIRRYRPIITAEFSLEMLRRVSGIEGPEFLGWMKSLGYRLYVLRRDGVGIEAIPDIAGYLSGWGSALRIEDIAFVPEERTFDPTS